MHHAPAPAPRCASCGATDLTPPTYVGTQAHQLRLELRHRGARPGFFAPEAEHFAVTHARVCLACGHVMLALPPEVLATLRARASLLEPEPAR